MGRAELEKAESESYQYLFSSSFTFFDSLLLRSSYLLLLVQYLGKGPRRA